jgi:hypothetical protein
MMQADGLDMFVACQRAQTAQAAVVQTRHSEHSCSAQDIWNALPKALLASGILSVCPLPLSRASSSAGTAKLPNDILRAVDDPRLKAVVLTRRSVFTPAAAPGGGEADARRGVSSLAEAVGSEELGWG